jgi:hypothetical protein
MDNFLFLWCMIMIFYVIQCILFLLHRLYVLYSCDNLGNIRWTVDASVEIPVNSASAI